LSPDAERECFALELTFDYGVRRKGASPAVRSLISVAAEPAGIQGRIELARRTTRGGAARLGADDHGEIRMEQLVTEDRQELGTEAASEGRPWIVNRSEIPASSVAELVVRRFLGHSQLADATACPAATLALIEVRPGREVEVRSHATPSLLVILKGTADLTGKECAPVEEGDVVTLPRNHEYGFRAVGPAGLQALLVTFLEGDKPEQIEARTYEQLVARNEQRTREALASPYFRLLHEGDLNSARSRTRFRDCVRVFSDFFQTFLLTRQAMCRDTEYNALFNEHLVEELGHNLLLRSPESKRIFTDPVLLATSTWFAHQMLILDNAGKAVVNLVLETAGYHFHSLAKPVFEGDEAQTFFDTHAEADEHHKDVGVELLEGHTPEGYVRLQRVLEESWDAFGAMSQRIVDLVQQDEASS
jgi:mannose-6-phosphate isomerase-like protein (cupin superfamily)